MRIEITSKGKFLKTKRFLKRCENLDLNDPLQLYAEAGLEALRQATPIDSGKTRDSWSWYIEREGNDKIYIQYTNDNIAGRTKQPIVSLLVRGHATGSGGYVYGYDFVTPIMDEIVQQLADAGWKEVTKV